MIGGSIGYKHALLGGVVSTDIWGAERTISVLNQTHFSDTRENGILSGVRFLFLSAISLLKEVLHGVGRGFLQ